MNDFNQNSNLFLGPMGWVGGVVCWAYDTVEITSNGDYVNWYFGLTLIGGK